MMSKELEAFEIIKKWYSVKKINTTKPYEWQPIQTILKDECEIVEAALKDYRTLTTGLILGDMSAVDNKKLKALESLEKKCNEQGLTLQQYLDYFVKETIDNEKKLKALEIIKRQGDFIFYDKECTIEWRIPFVNGFQSISIFVGVSEEFELLKEMLL